MTMQQRATTPPRFEPSVAERAESTMKLAQQRRDRLRNAMRESADLVLMALDIPGGMMDPDERLELEAAYATLVKIGRK